MQNDWVDKFYYDETSPSGMRWKVDVYSGRGLGKLNVKKGSVAGHLLKGRWQVTKESNLVHRVLWYIMFGEIPAGLVIDHKDGDASNNTISNLRLVTNKVNMRNKKMLSRNSSGVCGVNLTTSKGGKFWCAQWVEEDGSKKSKWYSVLKYGDKAFELAVFARTEAIKKLNEIGAGYTERHGKGK